MERKIPIFDKDLWDDLVEVFQSAVQLWEDLVGLFAILKAALIKVHTANKPRPRRRRRH